MSKKWLNHNEWVLEQFQEKYLKKRYRNIFIHASIIESVLVNKCGIDNFYSANKCLLYSKDINSTEFSMFDKIRKNRNKVAHEIFKNKGFSQRDIDKILHELRATILRAYRTSNFLDRNLFKKYNIPRVPDIIFKKSIK
jgi:hypothetical protein